jgi:hypothetical protein
LVPICKISWITAKILNIPGDCILKIIKRDFTVVVVIAILISSLTATIAPATHAVEKAGSKCTVFGKTVVKGKTKRTCVKVTEYKWGAAPIKPALASIYNPVLPGNKFKLNTLQFQAGPVNFDFGDEVCRENAFNDGCVFNGALLSSVDPDSPNRWIGVDLLITNLTKKSIGAVDLNYSFYMILPNGKYIESARGVIYENAPIDIKLAPNVPTTMRVAFALPKVIENLNPIIVVRDDSAATSKEYFFYLNW